MERLLLRAERTMELRGTLMLVGVVWNYEATGVEELGERAGGLICVRITETESRGRWGDLGHLLAS